MAKRRGGLRVCHDGNGESKHIVGLGKLRMREESSGYTLVWGNYKLILYNKEGGY